MPVGSVTCIIVTTPNHSVSAVEQHSYGAGQLRPGALFGRSARETTRFKPKIISRSDVGTVVQRTIVSQTITMRKDTKKETATKCS